MSDGVYRWAYDSALPPRCIRAKVGWWIVETRNSKRDPWRNNLARRFASIDAAYAALDEEVANWKNPDPEDARVVAVVATYRIAERPKKRRRKP